MIYKKEQTKCAQKLYSTKSKPNNNLLCNDKWTNDFIIKKNVYIIKWSEKYLVYNAIPLNTAVTSV